VDVVTVTDCAAPRHQGQDEPSPAAPHAALCYPCIRRLAADLRRLPGLHTDLTQLTHARTAGDGTGLPFSEPAADCQQQIRHDLTWWAVHVTRTRGLDAPPVLLPGWADNPVLVMAGWLHGQVTWCSFRDWAPDMAGALADDRSRAVALLDPWVTKRFPIQGRDGLCVACDQGRAEVTVYASEGDRRRSFIACPACGTRWEPEQWASYGRAVIRRREIVA
jgi:hypothetical protein